LTSGEIADMIQRLDYDLRHDVWIGAGISKTQYTKIMMWLDYQFVTRRGKSRRRYLVEPHEESIETIRNTVYRDVSSLPIRKDEFVLIERGPHEIFNCGMQLSNLEMRESDGREVFANGTRFQNEARNRTAFWYNNRLWIEGETPKPWF
jgi:hypothetical protein